MVVAEDVLDFPQHHHCDARLRNQQAQVTLGSSSMCLRDPSLVTKWLVASAFGYSFLLSSACS